MVTTQEPNDGGRHEKYEKTSRASKQTTKGKKTIKERGAHIYCSAKM